MVPFGTPISSALFSSPPSITYLVPQKASCDFVISSTIDTAAILERASPLNPRDATVSKSIAVLILLVEWRKKARGISSFAIPQPLSVILMKEIPPSFISIVIAVAFASIAFSNNSFTTDAGLSITSPAAI